MTNEVLQSIISNLKNVGWAMLIFCSAYVSNMAFSMYYNIKLMGQPFDYKKIINSCVKVGSIVLGLAFLVVAATALPAFANYVGWQIPDEYVDVFDSLAILGVCLVVSCKYIAEAIRKFSAILNESKITETTEIKENIV